MCSSGISGMHSGLLAAQIRDLNNGNSTSILINNKKLDCNEDCAQLERNRRLALALQIENPDMSSKLGVPKYSEFLKDMAKKDPTFATMVHDKLTDLVKLAKNSKQKSRSYSFEHMNRDKRTFVHELSDHFGVESESYDAEPKRNVVATAVKDRAWLPSQSIVEVVMGIRKTPLPVTFAPSKPTFTTLQPSKILTTEKASEAPVVDYFDYEDWFTFFGEFCTVPPKIFRRSVEKVSVSVLCCTAFLHPQKLQVKNISMTFSLLVFFFIKLTILA